MTLVDRVAHPKDLRKLFGFNALRWLTAQNRMAEICADPFAMANLFSRAPAGVKVEVVG